MDFFKKNAEIFDEEDENKLEYTAIFHSYKKTLEKYIMTVIIFLYNSKYDKFIGISWCNRRLYQKKAGEATWATHWINWWINTRLTGELLWLPEVQVSYVRL